MAADAKNSESFQPNSADVLDAVKDLSAKGILAQDGYTGMLHLDLEDDWVFKSMKVLKDYGYIPPPFFVFPPVPLGAHVMIVDEREAVDYELVGEREGKKEIPGLGRIVDFKVVDAFPFHPQIRVYGVESRYKITVESAKLDKIRKDLTGLPPRDLGFCIDVGVRMEDMLHKIEQKSETKTSIKTSTSKPEQKKVNAQTKTKTKTISSNPKKVEVKPVESPSTSATIGTEEEEIKVPKLAPASKSKTKSETKERGRESKPTKPKESSSESSCKTLPAPASMLNKSNLLLLAVIIINTATLCVMSSYGYNYFHYYN